MANSSAVTSKDSRADEPYVRPIWEIIATFTIEAGGGVSEISQAIAINGSLKEMTIEVGAAGGITGTVNVDLDDNRDIEFDTNAALGELTDTIVSFNTGVGKVVDGFTIRLTPSDDPTTGNDDWEIVVTCRGD